METVFHSSSSETGEALFSSNWSHLKQRYTFYTQTEVPAPWIDPVGKHPKVWINKTTTTASTQTDILIDLTIDEPWVEHVVERTRSPADNKLTIELVHTFWDKIFDILGTGD